MVEGIYMRQLAMLVERIVNPPRNGLEYVVHQD
jgi:hypothetical protein